MNFVFDMDGTICFDGQTIAKEIVEALQQLVQKGHTVIFASARPIRDMLPIVPLPDEQVSLIGGNGAFIKQGAHITCVAFSQQTTKRLQQLIHTYDVTYLADSDWDYAYTGDISHRIYAQVHKEAATKRALAELEPLCKIVLFAPPEALLQELRTLDVVCYVHTGEQLVDISPQHITKWHGLQQLGIVDYVAFGNDVNDVCLFEHARYSVSVGNAALGATVTIARADVCRYIEQLAETFYSF